MLRKASLEVFKGTLDYGIALHRFSHLNLTSFIDADWATDIDDRRSITEYYIYLGQNLVTWCSKKQPTISRSSIETEYQSLANGTSEILWLQSLLQEMRVTATRVP
ncbi:hypothetical protein PanWU01x14_093930, partial [Parasponia andersonii]